MCGGQRVGVCVLKEGGGGGKGSGGVGGGCQIVLSHWQIIFPETAELWEKKQTDEVLLFEFLCYYMK